jgi:mycothiol system anti-sigma-R factor
MKCTETLKLYQLYVDDELDESGIDKIKKHIDNCPDCHYRVRFEVKFQTTITRKIKSNSEQAPDSLREKILKKIS